MIGRIDYLDRHPREYAVSAAEFRREDYLTFHGHLRRGHTNHPPRITKLANGFLILVDFIIGAGMFLGGGGAGSRWN